MPSHRDPRLLFVFFLVGPNQAGGLLAVGLWSICVNFRSTVSFMTSSRRSHRA